jgi:hypothetical protein
MSEVPVSAPSGLAPVPPPDDKKSCRICATRIALDAKKCTACQSWQKGKPCVHCATWISRAAIRCEKCSTFQNWRRRIPGSALVLALLVSLVSALGPAVNAVVYVFRLPSETTASVLDASTFVEKVSKQNRVLLVQAINFGGSSSLIRRADVDLTSVGAVVVKLENLTARNAEVPANGRSDLMFFAEEIQLDAGKTKNDVALALCTHSVTLLLRVDERNRLGKLVPRPDPLRIEVPGPDIRDWVLDKIAGGTTEDWGDCG